MYRGPRNPNSSPFQDRSRPPPQHFRPRFENPGFPPQPRSNVYRDFRPRQPFPSSTHFQRPFGMNTHPQGPGVTFQPREWQTHGPRRGFRLSGIHGQQVNRGRGSHRRSQDSSGIEAYYRHSMVEDPWKQLEEQYKNRNQQP